ncbi:MAG: SRPBCC family protein [Gemmatimonadaceae bacterium]
MSLSLRESFPVNAPPDRVWEFLIDPARVVRCLPGAELLETVNAQTYRGRVKVKVGPISTAYDGTAQLTTVDQAARRMQLVGEGKEVGAAGSARMQMTGTVREGAAGGSQVEVEATIDIAGRVMQFGRGLIESVSRQLFKQFAEAVRATLDVASQPTAATSEPDLSAASTPGPTAGTTPTQPRPAEPTRELHVLPLLWHALIDWVKRLFGKGTGIRRAARRATRR